MPATVSNKAPAPAITRSLVLGSVLALLKQGERYGFELVPQSVGGRRPRDEQGHDLPAAHAAAEGAARDHLLGCAALRAPRRDYRLAHARGAGRIRRRLGPAPRWRRCIAHPWRKARADAA